MSENSIALVIAENPVLALTDKEKFAEFLKDIKAEIDAHIPDVSTPKGRAEISSLAYKVTRSKTAIDKAGKELNAVKRKEIDAVDAERRAIWDRLETLANEVRKPLTEWETAEEERQKKVSATLENLRSTRANLAGLDSSEIALIVSNLEAWQFPAELYQGSIAEVVTAHGEALAIAKIAFDVQAKYEADQVELNRLREESARREAEEKERLEREAQEKAAAERRERDEREAKELAEQAEKRRQQEIADAAEKAQREEREKAQKEQAERDRVAREALEKANREAEELRQKERDRQILADREKAAQEARDKDRKHRGEIMKAAKEAIMSVSGADEETAKKIVLAIVAGEIPNTKVTF